jgi:poly-gamma-glutamate synthesis protein (capsule biosynthesis protein)
MKRLVTHLLPAAAILPALLLGSYDRATAQEVTLVAGGDIEWSRITKAPQIAYDTDNRQREDGWIRVPHVITAESKPYLEEKLGRALETPESHHIRAIHYGLEFETLGEMARYPLQKVAPILREADIAFANLETPLSDKARHSGAFRTPPAFADGLKWAGIDVVSTANNHALDAEGEGLLDTKAALWEAGVGAVGTGRNLEDARRPFIVERNGIKVAFLGYAIAVNAGGGGFALPNQAGVVPLDPFIVKEDIRRVRDEVDYVAVSFHWAIENSQDTHADARAFAYEVIDEGADIILGHHPHVPRGVEVYNGKVIFYSFGNLIFGHNHTYWMDNYLGRLTLTPDEITKVEILPVAGTGQNLSQPYLLEGEEAQALLQDVQARSAQLDTRMEIEGDVGIIIPRTAPISARR